MQRLEPSALRIQYSGSPSGAVPSCCRYHIWLSALLYAHWNCSSGSLSVGAAKFGGSTHWLVQLLKIANRTGGPAVGPGAAAAVDGWAAAWLLADGVGEGAGELDAGGAEGAGSGSALAADWVCAWARLTTWGW